MEHADKSNMHARIVLHIEKGTKKGGIFYRGKISFGVAKGEIKGAAEKGTLIRNWNNPLFTILIGMSFSSLFQPFLQCRPTETQHLRRNALVSLR